MNPPEDGTNQLPKAGFDWNRSKGHFSRSERSKFATFSPILTLIVHLFKICSVTLSLFWHEASPGW